MTHVDFRRDAIQGVTPAITDWGRNYALMEYTRHGLHRIFAHTIPVKEMFYCLYCGTPFIEDGFRMYCSERCEVLAEQALDVERGK